MRSTLLTLVGLFVVSATAQASDPIQLPDTANGYALIRENEPFSAFVFFQNAAMYVDGDLLDLEGEVYQWSVPDDGYVLDGPEATKVMLFFADGTWTGIILPHDSGPPEYSGGTYEYVL